MNRMCIDPGQYEPDEYWQSIGVTTAEQVQHERLWRAAETSDPPEHLAACAACSELFESFVRLRAAAVPTQGGEVAVTRCPDAQTIADYQGGEIEGERFEAIRRHLKVCPPCREDVAFLARSLEPRERMLGMRTRLVLMAVAAAALLATVIPWKRGQDPSKVIPDIPISSKWAYLAHIPEVNRAEVMKESPADHHSRLEQVLEAYENGQFAKAEEYAGIMTSVVEDSSAEYLLAMARYKQNKIKEGYKAMLVSEKMAPQTAQRCWATLNYALLVGDRHGVEREARHAGAEEDYAPRCRDVLSKIG